MVLGAGGVGSSANSRANPARHLTPQRAQQPCPSNRRADAHRPRPRPSTNPDRVRSNRHDQRARPARRPAARPTPSRLLLCTKRRTLAAAASSESVGWGPSVSDQGMHRWIDGTGRALRRAQTTEAGQDRSAARRAAGPLGDRSSRDRPSPGGRADPCFGDVGWRGQRRQVRARRL
jgi:hypothetical protein